MATVIRAVLIAALAAGCGDLVGFGGGVPPLASIPVQTSGDLAAVAVPGSEPPDLHVALVWGAQWLTEAFCILPPDDPSVAAAIAAGCRDPFGFVPDRVGANVAIEAGVPATVDLVDLPAADVMVGDVTARVAYGSFVVYDDRDHNGTLDLGRANRLGGRDMGPPDDPYVPSKDVVYGASFVTMTASDTRLAFREGGFNEAAAFYPRRNCGDPPPAFSLVSAGGFSAADALAAQAMGMLPPEDPATCREAPTTDGVTIAFRPPPEVQEVACAERRTDSAIRYREPPADPPDMTKRTAACAKVPDFGTGKANGMVQLVISGRSDDECMGLTHYVLRGCRQDATCEVPDWDITATPPAWWPCPAATARTRGARTQVGPRDRQGAKAPRRQAEGVRTRRDPRGRERRLSVALARTTPARSPAISTSTPATSTSPPAPSTPAPSTPAPSPSTPSPSPSPSTPAPSPSTPAPSPPAPSPSPPTPSAPSPSASPPPPPPAPVPAPDSAPRPGVRAEDSRTAVPDRTVVVPGAPAAKSPDDDGEPKLSLPTEADREAWRRSGFRLGLGLAYGRMVGLRGAPSGRLIGAVVRAGLRLDEGWSILASFQYAQAKQGGGLSGLRFAGTIDPTWHVTRSLSLAVGFGFGGIVEGSTGRMDADPLPSTLDTSYTFPDASHPIASCSGVGAAGLARIEYAYVIGPRAETLIALEVIGQWTGCVDDTKRVEPDTGVSIVRRQWWPHTGGTLTWSIAWR